VAIHSPSSSHNPFGVPTYLLECLDLHMCIIQTKYYVVHFQTIKDQSTLLLCSVTPHRNVQGCECHVWGIIWIRSISIEFCEMRVSPFLKGNKHTSINIHERTNILKKTNILKYTNIIDTYYYMQGQLSPKWFFGDISSIVQIVIKVSQQHAKKLLTHYSWRLFISSNSSRVVGFAKL